MQLWRIAVLIVAITLATAPAAAKNDGKGKGKGKDKLQIIDFANFTHKWLLKHSLTRLKMYKAEECFVISAG